jgi:Fic family protein/plasmid maintenance system antidote protein VapI
MKSIIKNARLAKGLKTRELAQMLQVDQALVSKFEAGTRKPTRAQVLRLAELLDINSNQLLITWMKEKIIYEIGDESLALEALMAAEEEIKYRIIKSDSIPSNLKALIDEADRLKLLLDAHRSMDSYRIKEALELEYTYESNRIEGNTLSLKETDLVINEGITIAGKSMREHLEAINHKEAVEYIKHLIDEKSLFNERELLNIHNLILRGIDPENAGRYRRLQVMIKGSQHTPPQPYMVQKAMEDFFIWFEKEQHSLHPIMLAALVHEKVVSIHPFIDGNGRTCRLLMNLLLLKKGYVIANIKGDKTSRHEYYNALEHAQIKGATDVFIALVAKQEIDALRRYLQILGIDPDM